MSMTLTLNEFAEVAPLLYKAKRPDGRSNTVVLQGAPGIGKSAAMKSVVRQSMEQAMGRRVVIITDVLADREVYDLRGIALPYKEADGSPAMGWTKPDLFVRVERALAHYAGEEIIVLLFVDEIDKLDHSMQKAAAEFLDQGRLGTHTLPGNVWIVAAGNMSARAGTVKRLTHVTNRLCVININQPVDTEVSPHRKRQGWVPDYAEPNGLPVTFTAFAKFREALFAEDPPTDGSPYLTFRSLTRAAEFIKANKPHWVDKGIYLDPDDFITRAIIEGYIGVHATDELYGYVRTASDLPSKEEIVANPETAKVPHTIDGRYAVAMLLGGYADADNIDKVFTYATRLNREFQAMLVITLTNKAEGGVLLNAPVLNKWFADPENRALMTGAAKVRSRR